MWRDRVVARQTGPGSADGGTADRRGRRDTTRVGGGTPREEPRGDAVGSASLHTPPALRRLRADGHRLVDRLGVPDRRGADRPCISATTIRAAIKTEEAFLRSAFGGDYDAYSQGRNQPGSPAVMRRFSFERAMRNKEYRAMTGLVIASLLLVAKMCG